MQKNINQLATAISVTLALSAPVIAKVDNHLSAQSFTGAFFTPNAQVIDQGDASLFYGQGVPHNNHIAELDNMFFAASFAPGLEAGGRVVTQTYDCNIYTESNCGIRDLSASVKYQLPFVHDYTGFNLAIGAQDIGGAANNFEAYYLVADYEFEILPLRVSAGYGQSELAMGIMDGPFGSVELQPLSFVQLIGEYDSAEVNAAAKVFTPEGLLPYGAQVAFQYQLYSGHKTTRSNVEDQTVWSVNASIPLLNYNFTEFDQFKNIDQLSVKDKIDIAQSKSKAASLKALETALIDEGFLNVQFGKNNNKLVIALENRRYNQNQIDGIGVALGIITSHVGEDMFAELEIDSPEQSFELFALVNAIPMIQVSSSATCYREFIRSNTDCSQLKFSTIKLTTKMDNVAWIGDVKAKGAGKSQLIFSPAIRHRDATEYGVFDFSLALSSNLYTPLWQGAAIDIRHLTPIDNSDDFEDGRIWQDSRYESEVDRAMIHQAFRFPFDVSTQFSYGVLYKDYKGILNDTQWRSPTGMHTVAFQVSDFAYKDDIYDNGAPADNKSTSIASYTLDLAEYNWQGEIQTGSYWNGDSGFKVTSMYWVGDVKLSAEYQNTTAEDADEAEEFVKLSVTMPLTFWRDMKPNKFVQIRGTDNYVHSVQTRIGNSHNNLNAGLGGSILLKHNLTRQYYNNNRISVDYYDEKQVRLRNAYLRYLEL